MLDLDSIAPQFRRAMERWPEAPTLANHYKAVAECYAGSGHSLIASVKSFIECVCITLLGEFGKEASNSDPSTTELLVEALKAVGLQNSRGASRIDKLLSAHNKMADALSDMRNENDPVAHGKDGFLDALTANECRAFLITADTIAALLLSAYEGKEPNLESTRENYDRFAHFNERIDRAVSLEAIVEDEGDSQLLVVKLRAGDQSDESQIRVLPSQLLYALDRSAYKTVLISSPFRAVSPPEQAPAIPAETPAPAFVFPDAEVVSTYQGAFLPLKVSFDQHLESLGFAAPGMVKDGANLSDSLLATAEQHVGLDWAEREPLQAAMRVALRRTLIRFGFEKDRAEKTAGDLVSWFKTHAAGLANTESA